MPHGGYGLGNDLIPWAKGYILASQLNAYLLHPAWGNNRRGYARYFRTGRFDWQGYRLLARSLPKLAFTEHDYRASGQNDFCKACALFINKNQLLNWRHYIVTITGLWGAFSGIKAARHFVMAQLLTTNYTQKNLIQLMRRLEPTKLTVGIHVRLGDFRTAASDQDLQGAVNTRLPMAWYRHICALLTAAVGEDRLQFLIASDGSRAEVRELLDEFPSIFSSELPNSDCSDLIALSEADLLICSLSTFSAWAAFISHAPYIWSSPNLSPLGRNCVVNKAVRAFGNFDAPKPE